MTIARALALAVGADRVSGPEEDLTAYERGWRGDRGHAACVVRPRSTVEVSAAVATCVRAGVAFVAQSANTGVVGGSTPDDSGAQVVISLERLTDPCRLDPDNRTVEVGAGVRLSALNARIEDAGFFFPIDLGADPMIGGMVATNTGGARFLRYGDVRRNTLGLTVVLADAEGTILRLGSGLRKDNTEPDWKQLFVGTAGAFGVVTEAILNVEALPQQRATAVVVPRDNDAILELLRRLEADVGPALSAFELMSGNALRHALAHAPAVRNPFSGDDIPATALLIELALGRVGGPIDNLLEETLATYWEATERPISDAVLCPPAEIWPLRHALSEGVRTAGELFAFDLAFERPGLIAFRSRMVERLAAEWPELELCDFGHVGDGGVHFNLVGHDRERCRAPGYAERLRDWVLEQAVEEFGASFSAEHGIGRSNQAYYDRYTPAARKTLATRFAEALGLQPGAGSRFGDT